MLHIQRAFTTPFVVDFVKSILQTEFRPSTIYPQGRDSTAAAVQDPFRTSGEKVGGILLESGLNRLLVGKVQTAARSFGVSDCVEETDRWNVIKYEEGQEFKLHTDCWDNVKGEGSDQRVLTALIVLQQANEGGETIFPNLGLSIRPPAGTMLVWHNTSGGACNPLLTHAGTPPKNGTKIVMTKWYRGRMTYE